MDPPLTCPACGAESPPGSRFCAACGSPLAGRTDERRVVTVLFADLVGFTGLAEDSDPERVKEMVDGCLARLGDDVRAFGGRVDKVVGDALVALFGAPVAHEDDAERAVRAALRMHATVAEHHGADGDGFRLRVGVNTGEVLVGSLRAGDDYTAMGDVVNVASRLQVAAAPGEVLVGPLTWQAASPAVRFEPAGSVEVRGRSAAVEAARAVGVLAPPGRRLAPERSPFVGRDAEMALLAATVASVVARTGAHLVLVTGEPGIGKTRLIDELCRLARDEHGARTLAGQCTPYGETDPWFPIAEALRDATGIAPHLDPAEARTRMGGAAAHLAGTDPETVEHTRLVEGLLDVLGLDGTGRGADPSRARTEAQSSLARLLGALASTQPLILRLADLQWADPLVLETVERLLDALRDLPFMIIASARPELTDRWNERSRDALSMHLAALPEPAARSLARTLMGEAADDGLVEVVLERSAGNPFFVEELAAALGRAAELGRSDGPADPVHSDGTAHIGPRTGGVLDALPVTLHGLVAGRLDRMDPAGRALVARCAVIGPSGPLELVAALEPGRSRTDADGATGDLTTGDRAPDDDPGGARYERVSSALRELAAVDIIDFDGTEFRFRHQVVQEVAYATLTKAERARRHATLIRHLSRGHDRSAGFDDRLQWLAHHYHAAAAIVRELGPVDGVPSDLADRAAEFLEHAAHQAHRRELWHVARGLLDMALEVSAPTDGDRRRRVLIDRADASVEMHDAPNAARDLSAAAALLPAPGGPPVPGHAGDLGTRAAEVDQARLLTVRGGLERLLEEHHRAAETLTDAVARWRGLGDAAALADALRAQGMSRLYAGDLDGAESACQEAHDLFVSVGDTRGEGWALQNLAWIAFDRGDASTAETRLEASSRVFTRAGDWGGLGWALGLLGWVRLMQGRLDEAEALARQNLGGSGAHDHWAAGMMHVLVANVRLWRADPESALAESEKARDRFGRIGDRAGDAQAAAPAVRALACLGRPAEARVLLDETTALAAAAGDATSTGFVAGLTGQFHVHVGAGHEVAPGGREAESRYDPRGSARSTTVAWALLQGGRPDESLAVLDALEEDTGELGPAAAAARALALCAVGRHEAVVTDAARLREGAVTYLDLVQAETAIGLAAAARGDTPAAEGAFAAARRGAGASVLDRALVDLAAAHAGVVADPPGGGTVADAVGHLEDMGFEADGWDRAFRLAATAAPASA